MEVNKAYKVRVYPNKKQFKTLEQSFGCSRLIYNYMLDLCKNKNVKFGYTKLANLIPGLKSSENYNFLKDVDSTALQQSIKDLEQSFNRFFKGLSKYPVFKSRKNEKFTYRTVSNSAKIIDQKYLQLPKLGKIRMRHAFNFSDIIKVNSFTVPRDTNGFYYVSINCLVDVKTKQSTGNAVGIDLGFKSFAVLSTGERFEKPFHFKIYQNKLKKQQQKLSRKVSGSKNHAKQKLKVGKIHQKIKNSRDDFLHKVSSQIVTRFDHICVEDLDINGMYTDVKNINKKLVDLSFNKFRNMIDYKCKFYDKKMLVVDRYFPSTQKCSKCDKVREDKLGLDDRIFICSCGNVMDRDLNSSVNIKIEGLKQLVRQGLPDSKPVECKTKKQEAHAL